jgi:hypothetical protein
MTTNKRILHTQCGLAEITYSGGAVSCIRHLSWANLHEYLSWMVQHLEDVFPGIGTKDRETMVEFLSKAQSEIPRTKV